MLTDNPKYFHYKCSSFYTFGWCSEREMAFNSLVEIFSYKSKIKQHDIHTWSELCLDFKTLNNKILFIEFKVDNTNDSINYAVIGEKPPYDNWKKDIGEDSKINWYNTKAHSNSEISKVRDLKVSEMAAKRIKKLTNEWLEEIRFGK